MNNQQKILKLKNLILKMNVEEHIMNNKDLSRSLKKKQIKSLIAQIKRGEQVDISKFVKEEENEK